MKLKTFCIVSQTCDGILAHIVNAFDKKNALYVAGLHGAWTSREAFEIDTITEGCVFDSAKV